MIESRPSKGYSIIVPIYNDGYMAEDFCIAIRNVFETWQPNSTSDHSFELIFVNDGSVDDSLTYLQKLSSQFTFVKIIELSRNFGQHIALSCGYKHASGNYVGMMNVDMEDPPSGIPRLIEFMDADDFDIVYGLRRSRKSPWAERVTSRAFQILLNSLTGNKFPLNTSTLRIMNRKFVDAYNSLTEKSRYLPGLEMWIGFRRGFVETEHHSRKKGKSSYNFSKRLSMAFEAIISFSDIPLRWVVLLGFIVAFVGFVLNVVLVVEKLFLTQLQPGYTSTVSIIVFFSGIQMILLGMLGLYIGRILKEVQNRPLYLVRNKFNFGDDKQD